MVTQARIRGTTMDSEVEVHAGAHTQFKEELKSALHTRLTKTVKDRAGKSFEERMNEATKKFQAETYKNELEQRKKLVQCIEKGRSRPTSAPTRRMCDNPDRDAMLRERRKRMKEDELAYSELLGAIREKMDRREPLFRLSEVNAAIAMQSERREEHKQELIDEEHQRWEHLRAIEEAAFNRPLLVEDNTFRRPRGNLKPVAGGDTTKEETTLMARTGSMLGREEYEIDARIQAAVSRTSFLRSDWAEKVRGIRDKVDRRKKLHEIEYPSKVGINACLARSRMMHSFAA